VDRACGWCGGLGGRVGCVGVINTGLITTENEPLLAQFIISQIQVQILRPDAPAFFLFSLEAVS
jgi:hypothetical protein